MILYSSSEIRTATGFSSRIDTDNLTVLCLVNEPRQRNPGFGD